MEKFNSVIKLKVFINMILVDTYLSQTTVIKYKRRKQVIR